MQVKNRFPLSRMVLAVILLWMPIQGICGSDSLSAVDLQDGEPSSAFQFSAGYWNDNFLSVDVLRQFYLEDGDDDYVTASFWGQAAVKYKGRWWLLDSYLNILTNIDRNYRTDLLTIRLSTEERFEKSTLQYGAGMMYRGKFGGASIQNGYHNLFGYGAVDLPYLGNEIVGLTAYGKYDYRLKSARFYHFNAFGEGGLRTGGNPSNLRGGIETELRYGLSRIPLTIRGVIRTGYTHFFSTSQVLNPMFDDGILLGGMLGFTLFERIQGGFWLIQNQYGQNEPHFGMAFSFSGDFARPTTFSEGIFP